MKKIMAFMAILLLMITSTLAEEMQVQNSPSLMLKGNPTTGYDWAWEGDDEIVSVSFEYVRDAAAMGVLGGGGKYRITLTGIVPGKATITFTYKRMWEKKAPLYTLVYDVLVDEGLNVIILSSAFDW